MIKRSLVLCAIISSLVTLTALATAADIGAPELVGKWYGPFEVQGTETKGDATVTILDVTGTRVRGSIYMSATVLNPAFNKELPFEGELSGNTISTGIPSNEN
jgi:hypothetical protein